MRMITSYAVILTLLASGCNQSSPTMNSGENIHNVTKQSKGYVIEFPKGWKVDQLDNSFLPGMSGEQAIYENVAGMYVIANERNYNYSKNYSTISNEMAQYFSDNLYLPLAKAICSNSMLSMQPVVANTNNGRSIQAIYVCDDDVIWFTTAFGKNNAHTIIAICNKNNEPIVNTIADSLSSFKILH